MTSVLNAVASVAVVAGWFLLALAITGIGYVVASTIVFRRFFRARTQPPVRCDAVSLLKPLCGAEPALASNLDSFLQQRHDGPIQLVCGVARHDDPALAAVDALRTSRPEADIATVACAQRHGSSAKVSNLVNMVDHAKHAVIVLSDSDMVATPGYLAHVLEALDRPGVGAASVLYAGRGDAGFWSRFGAAGLSYQFLPGAVFGVATGLADPCMGSTIALTRPTMQRIGGLHRFADALADDFAIGEAVRKLGLKVAVPRFLMTHASSETSFVELWRHEVRWGATIRGVVPAAYIGSVVTMPVPLALLAFALTREPLAAAAVVSAVAARAWLMRVVDREAGARTMSRLLLPLRDCLSFAVFVASLGARSVDWRGRRHRLKPRGEIGPDTELVT